MAGEGEVLRLTEVSFGASSKIEKVASAGVARGDRPLRSLLPADAFGELRHCRRRGDGARQAGCYDRRRDELVAAAAELRVVPGGCLKASHKRRVAMLTAALEEASGKNLVAMGSESSKWVRANFDWTTNVRRLMEAIDWVTGSVI